MEDKKAYTLEVMAKGYQEMGEINLAISAEYFHLENEGEKITNEVVAKNC